MHFVLVTDRKHHLGQGAPQPSAVPAVFDVSWSFQSQGRGYACDNRARRSERGCERISRVGGGGSEGERRRKGRARRREAASSPGCAGVRCVGVAGLGWNQVNSTSLYFKTIKKKTISKQGPPGDPKNGGHERSQTVV